MDQNGTNPLQVTRSTQRPTTNIFHLNNSTKDFTAQRRQEAKPPTSTSKKKSSINRTRTTKNGFDDHNFWQAWRKRNSSICRSLAHISAFKEVSWTKVYQGPRSPYDEKSGNDRWNGMSLPEGVGCGSQTTRHVSSTRRTHMVRLVHVRVLLNRESTKPERPWSIRFSPVPPCRNNEHHVADVEETWYLRFIYINPKCWHPGVHACEMKPPGVRRLPEEKSPEHWKPPNPDYCQQGQQLNELNQRLDFPLRLQKILDRQQNRRSILYQLLQVSQIFKYLSLIFT